MMMGHKWEWSTFFSSENVFDSIELYWFQIGKLHKRWTCCEVDQFGLICSCLFWHRGVYVSYTQLSCQNTAMPYTVWQDISRRILVIRLLSLSLLERLEANLCNQVWKAWQMVPLSTLEKTVPKMIKYRLMDYIIQEKMTEVAQRQFKVITLRRWSDIPWIGR